MSDFTILTESTCDLPPEMAEKYGLEVVRLLVRLDGKEYENYLDGRELPFKDLYDSMRNKKLPTTSQVTTESFVNAMEKILSAGRDILYIGFSGPMSGTQNTGRVVARDMQERYPDRRILIVDSLSASIGEGLLVYLCAEKKAQGATLDETYAYANECVPHMAHFFTVTDLMHVARGGRATKRAAILGTMLDIKPIMNVNMGGLMDSVSKVRGRAASIKKIADMVAENLESPDIPIFIGHGDCPDEAQHLADMIRERTGAKTIYINYIGAVCGCHSGPGVLAAFYYGKHR